MVPVGVEADPIEARIDRHVEHVAVLTDAEDDVVGIPFGG